MNNMMLNELYNKIIDLDLSEYTHQKLYDLCFELDDEIERLNKEIQRLTAESTKWESKFYEEAKKNDKAIKYINSKEFIDYKKGLGNFERMLQHRKDLSNILKGVDKE